MSTIKVLNYPENENFFAGIELSDYQISTNGGEPTRGDIFRFAKMGSQLGVLTTEYGGQMTVEGKEFGFWPANEVEFIAEPGDETNFKILLENALSSAEGWRVWGKA